jgi:hypothetical protein
VSQALERVRKAAKQRKKERFTALFHHLTINLLRLSFFALKRDAAPGADGVTWQDYEAKIGVTQIAQRLGVSPATLYRYIPAARTANTPGVWQRPLYPKNRALR